MHFGPFISHALARKYPEGLDTLRKEVRYLQSIMGLILSPQGDVELDRVNG